MTFVITGACIDVRDESCIEVCPVDCIYTDEEARMCFVHPTECIDCGACESACPVGAIFSLEGLPREAEAFTAINASYFTDVKRTHEQVSKAADSGL